MSHQQNSPTLIICPACNSQVSNQAESCPRCGQPIRTRTARPATPQTVPKPRQQPMVFQTPPRANNLSPSKVLGIGCLGLLVFSFVLTAVLNQTTKQSSNSNPQSPQQPPSVSYPKERVQRGEKIFNHLAGKYKMMVEFGWQAKNISLPVPTSDWEKLSKEDQVNVSLYAESLVPEVRASPKKYVDRWKQRVETLELSYQEFVDHTSRLCDQCWEVEVGKPVKDINGIWDVEGQAIVSGATAFEFRRAAESNPAAPRSK
jgi:hypothetical protein